ncbi:MAG: ATP-dependent DNA helicase [Actinobacteria bacterium]|nr:ATP-dependent DNA helicase [Actinomycetota bacterium]
MLEALDAAVESIGGTPREGQRTMALAIADAIESENHLLVQAGTGTGKSLAYLIPALASGKRALVATATLALQRQLIERDLPRIKSAVEKSLGREVSFAIYKGVGNYLCKQKLFGSSDADSEILVEISTLEEQAKRLKDWSKIAGISGDRDDAPEVDRRVWAASSVSGRECVGAEDCAYGSTCFAVLAKAKAQSADIVVTNHTLLAIEVVDSHPILPDRDVVILDEAHEFSDRTTQAVTEELTAQRVLRAATMYRKFSGERGAGLSQDLIVAAEEFEEAIAQYRDDFLSGSDRGQDRGQDRSSEERRLEELPISLLDPIRSIKDATEAISQRLSADDEIVDGDVLAERARVKGAINEIKTVTSKMIRAREGNVLWFEPTYSTLYLAPLSVSEVLADNLFSAGPVIATSATMTVSHSFESVKRNLGIAEIEDLTTLDVGTPFDFEKQGMLYLASHLPEPTREGPTREALDELAELIEAADGRTLALFSSWRGVEAADLHLRKVLFDLEIPIITARRGDPVGSLVERFAKEERSVLIGTISLWQGVDVPGSSCILVAIDRIPFPRPDDPVMAARSRQADSEGGSGFMQVSLPRAALLFSMPPLWRTEDPELVRDSLRRLRESL